MADIKRKNEVKNLALTAMLVALIILLGNTPLGLIPLGFINVTTLCIPVLVGAVCFGWKKGLLLGLSFGVVSFVSALIKPSGLVVPLMEKSPVWVGIMSILPRLCIPLTAWFVYDRMKDLPEEKARKYAYRVFGGILASLMGILLITVFCLCGVIRIPAAGETAEYVFSRNSMLLLLGIAVALFMGMGVLVAAFLSGDKFREIIVRHAPVALPAVCGSLTNTVLYLGMMLLFYVLLGIDTAPVLALIGGTALIAGLSEATVAAILVPPILAALKRIHI